MTNHVSAAIEVTTQPRAQLGRGMSHWIKLPTVTGAMALSALSGQWSEVSTSVAPGKSPAAATSSSEPVAVFIKSGKEVDSLAARVAALEVHTSERIARLDLQVRLLARTVRSPELDETEGPSAQDESDIDAIFDKPLTGLSSSLLTSLFDQLADAKIDNVGGEVLSEALKGLSSSSGALRAAAARALVHMDAEIARTTLPSFLEIEKNAFVRSVILNALLSLG